MTDCRPIGIGTSVEIRVTEVSRIDATIMGHLKIEHYKVGVSTDRRFHITRNNIRPFINVGLNMTWMFSDLGKGALTWPKLLTLLNDSFTSFFRC